jgi:hypothetical protein
LPALAALKYLGGSSPVFSRFVPLKYIVSICTLVVATVFTALFAGTASAEPVCVSYYAAEAFTPKQCTAALKVFDGVQFPCMAVLWGTFGTVDNHGCTARFLEKFKDRPHQLEIHFSNESGRRRRRLFDGELLPRLSVAAYNRRLVIGETTVFTAVRKRARSIAHFLAQSANANSDVLISTGLEDDMHNDSWRVVLALLKENIPSVRFIRNREGETQSGVDFNGAQFVELHSARVPVGPENLGACIVTNDGETIAFGKKSPGDDRRRLSLSSMDLFIPRNLGSCLIYLWWCQAQGNCEGVSTPPRRRSFVVDSASVRTINRVLRKYN